MQRENLWMVQCMDRRGDDVTALREQHMVGHMKHIEDIVDHIAMAGPLKDEAGEQIVGSFLAYIGDLVEKELVICLWWLGQQGWVGRCLWLVSASESSEYGAAVPRELAVEVGGGWAGAMVAVMVLRRFSGAV